MRSLLVLIIANTFWAATASAEATRHHDVFGRYQQLHWDERDGLPQNTVLAIAATRDGYLWLGTYEGAVRFDGVRFTLFNPSTTAGIGNAFVTSLLEGATDISGSRPMAAASRAFPAADSRSTPCEMGCRATSSGVCSKTMPGRSGSAPTVAV